MVDRDTASDGEEYLAYNIRKWGGDDWTQELRSRGAKVGANFAKWTWWPNTVRGHALELYVLKHYGAAVQDTLSRMLYELTYENGGNVSDQKVLIDVCAKLAERLPDAHIDVAAMQEAVKNGLLMDEALKEDEETKKSGIDDIPYFRVYSPKVLPESQAVVLTGCAPINSFVQAFERIISATK